MPELQVSLEFSAENPFGDIGSHATLAGVSTVPIERPCWVTIGEASEPILCHVNAIEFFTFVATISGEITRRAIAHMVGTDKSPMCAVVENYPQGQMVTGLTFMGGPRDGHQGKD